ncbi:glutaminase A [Proteocatella sphenisci]|uniref:glutaminase A n=1 Tax=Proteocatella sphenisci TaxID=181070 RepID=UPI00048A97DA|nr:glutaminase A [Proteocatella sphenisci]
MRELLEKMVEESREFTQGGQLASYIPELLKYNKDDLGIYLIRNDGKEFYAGNFDKRFTIQSVCKPLILLLALIDNGEDYVTQRVGVESTGKAFNAIMDFSQVEDLKDHINPMVNIGAIAMCSMIEGKDKDEKFQRLLDLTKKLSGNENIGVNMQVFESERKTGDRNRALAYLLKSYGTITDDVDDVLDVYFKACSIEITCKDLANIGFVLSNNGRSKSSDEEIVSKKYTRFVNAILMTCGMYDGAGDFAIRVGIPAKSGVGGGILSVAPSIMGIGIYGPALDSKGNSIAGIKLLEKLSNSLYLSVF